MFRGDRLKQKRIEKNLTQNDLGEMIGVTKSAISFYENSKRTPSIEVIIDLIHIFAVDANYFLGTDLLVTIENKEEDEVTTLSNEELVFLEELKKNKYIYDMILEDAKRVAELIKTKIG